MTLSSAGGGSAAGKVPSGDAPGFGKYWDIPVSAPNFNFNIVKDGGGDPSWTGSFKLLGELAKVHGLVWGGDFKTFKDLVHVQRCEVSQQKKLFAGLWYPEP